MTITGDGNDDDNYDDDYNDKYSIFRSCDSGSWAQHIGNISVGTDEYIASLYWAAATMSSTGYGDIHAHDASSQLIAVLVMFVGLLLYGYCLSSIAATLANTATPK